VDTPGIIISSLIGLFVVGLILAAAIKDSFSSRKYAKFTAFGYDWDWYKIDPATGLPPVAPGWSWVLRPTENEYNSVFALVDYNGEDTFTVNVVFSKGDTDKYIRRTLEYQSVSILRSLKEYMETPNIEKFYGSYPPKSLNK